MSHFRGRSSSNEKVELSLELKRALALLQVRNLKGLEERFLSLDAFLKPWAEFRDSLFVAQPDALSRATTISSKPGEDGITRLDVLWSYTQFDEGELRYDARADKDAPEYTPDKRLHGIINKSHWRAKEYEKLLYAWLLQEFKVGKVINPWGFAYLEGRNICTVWERVFVPIIDAVRASYSVKGRRYYGQLALTIESLSPSRLAFPESNFSLSAAAPQSPTPVRLVSVAKTVDPAKHYISKFHEHIHEHAHDLAGLTEKHYRETERELQVVYPQYGSLVERPKFKQKMEEWLLEQRRRADWRRAVEAHGAARGVSSEDEDLCVGRNRVSK